ncbi:MAG: hypothetical protein H7338_15735 [Candidatus Sericytochromatia bacterium]|nr:hypothetical protein [Candidatus Sericytochromatia bacterium]
MTLRTTDRPTQKLRPLPNAVATQLHALHKPAKTSDTALSASHHTFSGALNPLDRTSLVGEYVIALTQLSSTPAQTASAIARIGHDLQDPTLTGAKRVLVVREHTQATAKLLFTATALPAVWTMASGMLPTWLSGARFSVGASTCNRMLAGAMNVARPIGDGVLFVGDAMYLRDRLTDDSATTVQKARALIDVGIDTTRLVAYVMPNSAPMKFAAGAAMFARTGLSLRDMSHRK